MNMEGSLLSSPPLLFSLLSSLSSLLLSFSPLFSLFSLLLFSFSSSLNFLIYLCKKVS
jgi:hypothetical protein